MNLDFDFDTVTSVEFGIGREIGGSPEFVCVPVDGNVQAILRCMAKDSWRLMSNEKDGPRLYEPSEKHGAKEYLFLPNSSEFVAALISLHNANQLPIDVQAFKQPEMISSYFCRLSDNKNRILTALRRASQFKGMLKSRNRLVRMTDDTMQLVPDAVFRLDPEFDLLIDSSRVHILHPTSFEYACSLQRVIQEAAPTNVVDIGRDLSFVDFSGIANYASNHTRAARYLASINSQGLAKCIDKSLLVHLCKQTDVQIEEQDERIIIKDGHELGFLEVLDRRRYEINLVIENPEHYRAASRRKIDS